MPAVADGPVAILGLGVMGGSLAQALAASADAPELTGWDTSTESADAALAAGAVDRIARSLADAVEGASLVVVALPLEATLRTVTELAEVRRAGAIVTDVASLKAPVRDAAHRAGLAGRWVGSHPMCGSEDSGFAAARADLYAGASIWIVPGTPDATARVAALWRSVGAHPLETDAEEHDRRMAWASHLPQATANALACALAGGGVLPTDLGPGGRDMTRLSASSPDMWVDLFQHAPPELVEGLRSLAGEIAALADRIEQGDVAAVRSYMEAGRSWKGQS